MTFFTRLRLTRFIFPSGRRAPRHIPDDILPFAPPHIPDDLMLAIFHLCDAHTLVNCSSVSERFHELILQIKHIRIEIPYTIDDHCLEPLDWEEELEECLLHFSSIQSVEIKFLCYGPYPQGSEQVAGSVLRWKYDSHGLFYLFIEECDRSDGDWSFCNVLDVHVVIAHDYLDALNTSIVPKTIDDIIIWCRCIAIILLIHPNINQVRAEDFRGQGRMLVEGAEFLDAFKGPKKGEYAMIREKIWVSPMVRLPFSQHVMHEVFVQLTRTEEDSDESLMENFCDEDEYYQVAAKMITDAASIEYVNQEPKYHYI